MEKFVFFALALSVVPSAHLSVVTIVLPGNCDRNCPTSWEPICAAGESGKKETFGNECALKEVMCQEGVVYNIVNNGVCAPESNAIRICATNPKTGKRRTFSNSSQLGVTSCLEKLTYTNITKGECCPTVCPYIYVPVCAHTITGETKTFYNICALNREACQENIKYSDISEGECKAVENVKEE